MLMHNRRKRAEWLADQQAQHRAALTEARNLLASGQHITEDQMLLINQERAAQEAFAAQKNKKGIFAQAKDALFSSVEEEDTKGGRLSVTRAVEEKVKEGKEVVVGGIEKAKGVVEEVERKKAEVVMDGRRDLGGVVGGPLDLEAQAVTNEVKEKSKSWTDWVLRR